MEIFGSISESRNTFCRRSAETLEESESLTTTSPADAQAGLHYDTCAAHVQEHLPGSDSDPFLSKLLHLDSGGSPSWQSQRRIQQSPPLPPGRTCQMKGTSFKRNRSISSRFISDGFLLLFLLQLTRAHTYAHNTSQTRLYVHRFISDFAD